MAVNQSHTENRRKAYVPYGESVLNQCYDVDLSFPEQPPGSSLFHGTKRGTLLLTSYRVIFVTSHSVSDPMLSFMMPFDLMSNCSLEQPVFAPIYIQGTVQAAPDAARGAPLQSITYWFGAPGLFIVSGQGSMTCNHHRSSPVVVHGPQPVRYGPPPAGYGVPPAGYGAPPAGYAPPPAGYAPPPAGYAPPPAGYAPPPAGYAPPPEGSEAPPVGYGAPPPRYEAPPPGYEAPPSGNRTGSHNPVAAQPDGYDASLPSTSSPQHHSPPSKN
ncbi:postacrosomal sheath WW domain-binding protein isoform X2 [Eptesicus fuscus]|uniref:postacrosomal sheath WW domain-binding protein isoform X2 n=1 Tax=Eptesicus fuscus TaxID=29078 RepID=UPI0024045A9F|nr:postacrosomal sheath WW domain-binding protein isoform X2 [Eptesicus fuscus]